MSNFSQAAEKFAHNMDAAYTSFNEMWKPDAADESVVCAGTNLAKAIVSYVEMYDVENSNNQDPLDFEHLDYIIVTDNRTPMIGSFIKGYRLLLDEDFTDDGWVRTSPIFDYEWIDDSDHDRLGLYGRINYLVKTLNTNYGVIVTDNEEFAEDLANVEW